MKGSNLTGSRCSVHRELGATLIEGAVLIALIGIVVAAALPRVGKSTGDALCDATLPLAAEVPGAYDRGQTEFRPGESSDGPCKLQGGGGPFGGGDEYYGFR